MLGKILSQKHGFDCTVVFSWTDGYIDPNNQKGLRGLKSLEKADLMIIGTRFRQPSNTEAVHITNYLNAGKPVIGFRTALMLLPEETNLVWRQRYWIWSLVERFLANSG